VNDKQRAELEASASASIYRIVSPRLAEDAQDADEILRLAQVLNTEVYRFLENSTQAIPAARYL
jgi:hypothetical protein